MADDTKRIVISRITTGVAGTLSSIQFLNPDTIQTNMHNIWFSIGMNPSNADTNMSAQWAIYREEDSTRAIFNPSVTIINLETINYKIVACGVAYASNQTPFNLTTTLGSTSRNVKQNGRFILALHIENLTAGNAEVTLMMCTGSRAF